VGIGTWTPNALFAVGNNAFTVNTAGAITAVTGISTSGAYTQTGNSVNNFTGNVGIGSAAPGQALDVQGTIRGLGEFVNGNVGIGTTFVNGAGEGALTVMNGNVGIGTWLPSATLTVNGNLITTGNVGNTTLNTTGGNVGIGTVTPGQELDVAGNIRGTQMIDTGISPSNLVYANASQQLSAVTLGSNLTLVGGTLSATGSNYWLNTAAPGNVGISTSNTVGIGTTSAGVGAGLVVMNGNVGIGTWAPGQSLDVNGTVRMTGLTLTGNGAASGNVLVTNGVGVGTWVPASTLTTSSQWTTTNVNDVFLPNNGNVGIGTSFTNAGAALSIMNGNVGIGTWAPTSTLSVAGSIAVHTVIPGAYPYTAATNDQVILASASSGNVQVNLPVGAAVPGREYVIKKTDATANTITILANGTDTIDGQASVVMTIQYQSFSIVSDGAGHWYIL
jgi:hypothetical protein